MYNSWGGSLRKKLFGEIEVKGILVTDNDLNQEPIRTDARFAGSLSLYSPEIVERGEQEGEINIIEEGFYYGRINTGLNLGHETEQDFDNQNFTMGAELTYVYNKHEGVQALIPSVSLLYERVAAYKTEDLDALAVDDDDYSRFRAEGSWVVPFDEYLPDPLKPLSFRLDARYYKEFDRPDVIASEDLDESKYFAGYLDYNFDKPLCYGLVSGVYLKVSDGRIPPVIENSTQIFIGIIVWDSKENSL